MSKTTGCIMKGFMWVVGIGSLVYGTILFFTNTSSWPQVEAVVTSSRSLTTDDVGTVTYETDYQYEVDGTSYQSYIHDSTQYREGERIKVYYDPDDPTTTITSQGEYGFTGCIGILFGLFCIGSMAWGAVKARRQAGIPAKPGELDSE